MPFAFPSELAVTFVGILRQRRSKRVLSQEMRLGGSCSNPAWRYNEAATEAPLYQMQPAELGRTVRQFAYMLMCALPTPIAVFAAGTGSQNSPTFSPGFLIAWLVCNGRKRNPIGGWLFFFYWQLYSGLLMTVVFFATNLQSYVPENFASTSQFALFLASAVPGLLLFVIKLAVATILLSVRTWDMLKLLRWVMVTELAADLLSAGIDSVYFPDNLALSFLTIVPNLLWLAYVFRSTRIRHIFYSHDWDVAVSSIYPPKLKMAT
jgi:hypothetical protein